MRKVLFCSGKIYYELLAKRESLSVNDVAIVRLEQLYPLRQSEVEEALDGVDVSVPLLWVQEEPENMGAWRFIRVAVDKGLIGGRSISQISRSESSSPASGSAAGHRIEQESLLEAAFS